MPWMSCSGHDGSSCGSINGPRPEVAAEAGALGGTRTPNLLIRSQMLYPLSYERRCVQ